MIQEAHKAFPATVEFVIPFQNERASPRVLLEELIVRYIQPLRAEGRKFYIEGTSYPFWTSTLQVFAPFDTSAVISSLSLASELSLDGFVVAETGWPQACPLNENRLLEAACSCITGKWALPTMGVAENPLGASSQTMGRSFAIRDMVTVLMA